MRYASIRSIDISNGEGTGVSLFVQGCHFHCYNCFNQETWSFDSGKEWTQEIKEKFLNLIKRPYIKRVSILGGEPLAEENLKSVYDLIYEINKRYNSDIIYAKNNNKLIDFKNYNPQKSIWIYSGYTWEEIFYNNDIYNENQIRKSIIYLSNIFVDGKYIDSKKDITLKWRGSHNQRVIDIKKTIENGEITLWAI